MRFVARRARKWDKKRWIVKDKKQKGAVVVRPMSKAKAEEYAWRLNSKDTKK